MTRTLMDVDPTSYGKMTTVPPRIIGDILHAAHNAYEATIDSPRGRMRDLSYDRVKSEPVCYFVSEKICENLNPMGYETEALDVYFPVPPHEAWHVVSAIQTPEFPERIIVDGTWQQFLPRRNRQRKFNFLRKAPEYPELLIGTSAEMAKVAMKFGFGREQALTWTPTSREKDNSLNWLRKV